MKRKITTIVSLTIASLLFAAYQPGNAVTYYGHDGSVDDNLTKIKVEPYKGKKDYWVYMVEACATDNHLAISIITLKSDIDEKVLGVNKTIKKEDCAHYGAVMKAKDSTTLGASMLERYEAIERMQEIIDGDSRHLSKTEKSELSRLQFVTGMYVR